MFPIVWFPILAPVAVTTTITYLDRTVRYSPRSLRYGPPILSANGSLVGPLIDIGVVAPIGACADTVILDDTCHLELTR